MVPHLDPDLVRADPKPFLGYSDKDWPGPARAVTGRTWGGCIEVLQWILTAGRFPAEPASLDAGILIVETSEEIISARELGWILRSLGERGLVAAANAVLVARPPASNFDKQPTAAGRSALRAEQREVAIDIIRRYNPEAVTCIGVPFGHTRPQRILPYGGHLAVDGADQKTWANYR